MNKFEDVYVAVIAGGQGTRLFPFSNAKCPKQFCELNDKGTFIQDTIARFLGMGITPDHVIVITTDATQYELAKEQTEPLGVALSNVYIIDPHFGYAGAMVRAAEFIHYGNGGKSSIVINTPADQYIVVDKEFKRTIADAVDSAALGNPTIIGVKSVDLNTMIGCGHARYKGKGPHHDVVGFIEKPDKETAEALRAEGNTACNTGINVWKTDTILDVITSDAIPDDKELKTDELMQKFGPSLKLVIGVFKWHDCGTLKSLFDVSVKDINGNVILGQGTTHSCASEHNLIYTPKQVEFRIQGLNNCAIVANWINGQIVVTVVHMNKTQQVRALANDYEIGSKILGKDLTLEGRNNRVYESNFSKDVICGFIGVSNIGILPYYNEDRNIFEINISLTASSF